MSRRLILLRHGRTAWNAAGIAQGHADVELDETGHAQAAAAAAYLATCRPARLWASDLMRTRQTCSYLEKETGLSATYDTRLREYDVGDREGTSLVDFAVSHPVEHAAWVAGAEDHPMPGAEVAAGVEARMVPVLREALAALAPGETGVVVAHGACLKVGLTGLLGWDRALAHSLRGMDNCRWARVEERERDGAVQLLGYGESV